MNSENKMVAVSLCRTIGNVVKHTDSSQSNLNTELDVDRVGFEPTTTYVSSANCMQGRYSTRLNYRPI